MIKLLIGFMIIIIWFYLNIKAEMSHDELWIKSWMSWRDRERWL